VELTVTEGILTVGSSAGVTLTGDASDNVTLTGTQAAINAALDGLLFTPSANANGTVTLSILTNDNGNTGSGGPLSASSSIDIQIAAINNAPSQQVPGNQVTDEDVALVFGSSNGNAISINDIDAGTAALNVTLSVGQGDLTLASTAGLTVTGNGSNTVSITGPQAAINSALDGLSYQPAANTSGVQTLTVLTNDNGNTGAGGPLSISSTVSIQINPINDAPLATNDTVNGIEDTDASFDVRANDNDADGDPLRVASINGLALSIGSPVTVADGTVSLMLDGSLNFTPAPNFFGPTSFSYTVTDDNGGISGATVNLIIAATNDVPTADNDSATTDEDTAVEIDVLANDEDIDGQPLNITLVDGQPISVGNPVAVTNGTVTLLPNGRLSFNPTPNFNGTSSFTYTVDDGNGGTAQAVSALTINAVNDAPIANPDTYSTIEESPITVDVRGNDSDPEGDSITVTRIDGALLTDNVAQTVANGSVTRLTDGRLVFDPDTDFAGSTSFNYVLQDANGATTVTSVTIDVSNVNDAPLANNDAATTAEDTAVDIAVTANDTDADGDLLTVNAVNGTPISVGNPVNITNGQVQLLPDGSLRFAPTPEFNGSASFDYTVQDGFGGVASATSNITVTPVNDAPLASNDTLVTAQDEPLSLDVRSNDTDVDGDLLTVTEVDGVPVTTGSVVSIPNGSILLASDGRLQFTPDPGFQGTSSFSYQVSDGNGASASASVAITVTPPNSAPAAVDDSFGGVEDTAMSFDVRTNDTDPESSPLSVVAVDGNSLTVNVPQAVNNGTITLQSDGSLVFNPASDFFGSTSFAYTLADNLGATDTATVTLNLAGVNDGVTAIDDTLSLDEDTPVIIDPRANDIDVDGDALTVIEINGSPLTIGSPVNLASGTISLQADGRLLFTPAPDFNGSESFSYTLSDGNGSSSIGLVSLTVDPVNDAPAAQPDNTTTSEDIAVVIDPRINDSDIDGDAFSVTTVNGSSIALGSPVNLPDGQVSLLADGSLRFSPAPDFNGPATFSYQVSDGALPSSPLLVTVHVTPASHPVS